MSTRKPKWARKLSARQIFEREDAIRIDLARYVATIEAEAASVHRLGVQESNDERQWAQDLAARDMYESVRGQTRMSKEIALRIEKRVFRNYFNRVGRADGSWCRGILNWFKFN